MNSEKPIRVLLADDNAVIRDGLCFLMQTQRDIAVVGEAANGREAVELSLKIRPDVILMDISMPQMNGFEATRLILKDVPSTKVIFLSAYGDGDSAYVESAAEAGASGYLVKQASTLALCEAVREVNKGNTYCSPAASKCFHARLKKLYEKRNSPS